jgi:nitrite reductase/ring-hydroxylating ferredoxin subunit
MMASIGRVEISVVSSSLNGDGFHSSPQTLLQVNGFAPDSLHEVEAVVDGDAESLILHRDANGTVRAWLNVCPHAGRRLDWAPGEFLRSAEGLLVCAVHGASFELATGECVAGPCRGEHLREVAVHCVAGEVRLGKNPDQYSKLIIATIIVV